MSIGLQYHNYYVGEYDGTVTVCAEIFEGCLERDLHVGFATIDATALSTYLHIYLHVFVIVIFVLPLYITNGVIQNCIHIRFVCA